MSESATARPATAAHEWRAVSCVETMVEREAGSPATKREVAWREGR
jgi:hypothetical protein